MLTDKLPGDRGVHECDDGPAAMVAEEGGVDVQVGSHSWRGHGGQDAPSLVVPRCAPRSAGSDGEHRGSPASTAQRLQG